MWAMLWAEEAVAKAAGSRRYVVRAYADDGATWETSASGEFINAL